MKTLVSLILTLFNAMQMQHMDYRNREIMKLKIMIGANKATAVLYDNPAGRDFASLLPLTLIMEDYAHTEKVANISRKLSTKDAPAGFEPSIGDLTYYTPWGNIAIFYEDFDYAAGLVSLGKITSGIEYFHGKDTLHITIESDQYYI